jgi:Protein of unknown function (DUF1194)
MRISCVKRLTAIALSFVLTCGNAASARATEVVDLVLVLAADVSRSVDAEKFKLQREGYAAALTNRLVLNAIASGQHKKIAVQFSEWSGAAAQAIIVDWRVIANADDAKKFATDLLAAPRPFADRTAIGPAIDFAMAQLARSPFGADRRVIDVSGDGTHNSGRDVTTARDDAVAKGVTINGLVILSAVPLAINPAHTHPPGGLLKYFEDNVIGGPSAFALAAESFEAFGQSVLTKLIKEIAIAPDDEQRPKWQ